MPRKQQIAENLPYRLQRILAQSGLTSRRKAEDLIREGRVTVDGQVVTELGLKIVPSEHRIEVDGQSIASPESKAYYLFNKPQGVLSTLKDPQGRLTIKDFLSRARDQRTRFSCWPFGLGCRRADAFDQRWRTGSKTSTSPISSPEDLSGQDSRNPIRNLFEIPPNRDTSSQRKTASFRL